MLNDEIAYFQEQRRPVVADIEPIEAASTCTGICCSGVGRSAIGLSSLQLACLTNLHRWLNGSRQVELALFPSARNAPAVRTLALGLRARPICPPLSRGVSNSTG
jgi:hypothetical protein